MQGGGEKNIRPGRLDNAPEVHDGHPVADVFHHAEIMGYEQVGQGQFFPQFRQEVDDLGLNRDIQGRHRLVGHHQGRVENKGSGDADALPLASAELEGVSVQN